MKRHCQFSWFYFMYVLTFVALKPYTSAPERHITHTGPSWMPSQLHFLIDSHWDWTSEHYQGRLFLLLTFKGIFFWLYGNTVIVHLSHLQVWCDVRVFSNFEAFIAFVPLTYSPAPFIPASRLLCLMCHIFFEELLRLIGRFHSWTWIVGLASPSSCYGAFIHSCLSFWGFAYFKIYSSKETAAEERYQSLRCQLWSYLKY